MQGERADDRVVIGVSGKDAPAFLQGLVSNDLRGLDTGPGLVWTALLSPQGKYLADFFVVGTGGQMLIDVKDSLAPALLKRLSMYRLRAEVTLEVLPLPVVRGLGALPDGALADPRHPALGWRRYGGLPGGAPEVDWDAIRVAHVIPESGIELIPDESYILECGFERLHGVDFRKGCYVGQEVTARMKHKTDLRKGLVQVTVDGPAAPGSTILSNGKEAGQLFTRSGSLALAHLRFDRAAGDLRAGEAVVTLAG